MVTSAQFQSNGKNATKSTGPRTPEGKQRSSRNAQTHGLYCRGLVLSCENEDLFLAMRQEYIDRLNPQDALELSFVDRVVQMQWKLNRILANEKLAMDCQECETTQQYEKRKLGLHGRNNRYWRGIDEIIDPMSDQQFKEWLSTIGLSHATFLLLMEEKNAILERLDKMRVRLENSISRAMRELTKLQTPQKNQQPQMPGPYHSGAEEHERVMIELLKEAQEELAEYDEEPEERSHARSNNSAPDNKTPASEQRDPAQREKQDPDSSIQSKIRDPKSKIAEAQRSEMFNNVQECSTESSNAQNEPSSKTASPPACGFADRNSPTNPITDEEMMS